MIDKTDKIWHNGEFIDWDDARIHVMAHVVNYGTSVFEGIRCYSLPQGPAIFRAHEHIQRLLDSAKIYRMEVPYTREELVQSMLELVAAQRRLAIVHPAHHPARLRRCRGESVSLCSGGLDGELSLGEIPCRR